MKIFKIIKKKQIPLNGKQHLALLIIIAAIFQFVLFYAPVLADQVAKTNLSPAQIENLKKRQTTILNSDQIIVNDSISKNTIDKNTLQLIAPQIINRENNLKNIKNFQIGPQIKPQGPMTNEVFKKENADKNQKKHQILRTSFHLITAYNSEISQTDDTPCITATGFNVCKHGQEDTIAANFLKFGTKVKIPELFGDKIFIVRDRMNQKYNKRIDIWMKNKNSARQFGRKMAKVEVIK